MPRHVTVDDIRKLLSYDNRPGTFTADNTWSELLNKQATLPKSFRLRVALNMSASVSNKRAWYFIKFSIIDKDGNKTQVGEVLEFRVGNTNAVIPLPHAQLTDTQSAGTYNVVVEIKSNKPEYNVYAHDSMLELWLVE